MKAKHATVRIGEYVVPLIGIPEEAVTDPCQRCGKPTHIADLVFVDGLMLCAKCAKEAGK